MKTVLVIPAYNEVDKIGDVVRRVFSLVDEVVVVDDGSGDGTALMARDIAKNVFVLRHRVNLGKGAALKTGCQAAIIRGAEIIVTVDGDGQHPAEHIPQIVRLMNENKWQFVFTVRQGGHKMPLIRFLGNRALNAVARYLYGLNIRDLWCGFRVMRADVLSLIDWNSCDYSGEAQMALKVGRSGLRYGEYVIPIIYNDNYKGVTIIHGLKLLAQMIIWRIKL